MTSRTISHRKDLSDFLNNHRLGKINLKGDEKEYTHVGMGPDAGKYVIPEDKVSEFNEKMVNAMFVEGASVHIAEVTRKLKPITIDLDFKYKLECTERQHTDLHLRELCKLYNEAIRKYIDLGTETALKSYVFERDEPYENKDIVKDGVHIIYPFVVCPVDAQLKIRSYVLSKCDSVLSDLPLLNAYDDVFDKSVINVNPWMMYGCSKPHKQPYLLSKVYQDDGDSMVDITNKVRPRSPKDNLKLINELTIHKDSTDWSLFQFKERRNKIIHETKEPEAENGKEEEGEEAREEDGEEARERGGESGVLDLTLVPEAGARKDMIEIPAKITSDETIRVDEIKHLVSLLSKKRADDYRNWISVGYCLRNLSGRYTPQLLLEDWINFSKKSAKFKAGECEKEWTKMKFIENGGIGVGSLYKWAKEDNPEGIRQMKRKNINNYIVKSISKTTQDVAEVVYQMYKHDYVCTSEKGEWFEFKGHRWHQADKGISLKSKIGTEVLEEYIRVIHQYNADATKTQVQDQKVQCIVKAKLLIEITYLLRDITFKEKLMKELAIRFHDNKFLSYLDTNPDLIGFENGVFDLTAIGTKDEFRAGRPEDYLSFSTGNDYVVYDSDDPILIGVDDFLNKVLPKPAVRSYTMRLFSSFLDGHNRSEKIHVFTGSGGNGKSKLIELFRLATGPYSFTLPISLLTGKRAASNAANPELARGKGCRFGAFQEPGPGEKINVGLMKELTGGDTITARGLYKDPVDFKPQFKLVASCNEIPEVPPDDEATWRRLRIIDFCMKFVYNPDPANPYQSMRDDDLSTKLALWREAFMQILLDYYRAFKRDGFKLYVPDRPPAVGEEIDAPPDVLIATNKYKKEINVYESFMDEELTKFNDDEGAGECIKLNDLYSAFKDWYKDAKGEKPPTREKFRKNLEMKLGKYDVKKGWTGWGLRSDSEKDGDKDISKEL
jgi:P4 family phage/plasmid primase-like protien